MIKMHVSGEILVKILQHIRGMQPVEDGSDHSRNTMNQPVLPLDCMDGRVRRLNIAEGLRMLSHLVAHLY